MGKRRLPDEPRCESQQKTSYKKTRGNSALSIVTMPQGNDTLDSVTMARKEREKNGPWEAELSYGGEADLHKHLKRCEKNPGHEDFIPVDQFHVKHLPNGYQDNDIVELVKAISDITVRVSVKYVSDRRPAIVPDTNKPYPCYKNRGSNLMTIGSGWVSRVKKFTNICKNCDCKECLRSKKPETNFAHIEITTAAHVVYDRREGAHTTCDLFFDRGGTPDGCSGVVTLSGMTRVKSHPEFDRCYMTYATHDLDIIDKLDNMVVHWQTLLDTIRNKYGAGFNQGRLMSPTHASVPKEFPIIIVSHPHGCSKQVSVGYWSAPNRWSNFDDWLILKRNVMYTTATCPGCSGANAWGIDGHYKFSRGSPHSGNWEEDKNLNFSRANYCL